MAKAKKTNGIQAVVDSYAAGIVRRGVLHEQTRKNELGITENGDKINTHVLATSPTQAVAYHAANGRTLIVEPDRGIRTIEPGSLKAPELPPPPTAEVADSVAELLSKGMAAEAQRLITEAMTGGQGAQENTATAQGLKQDIAHVDQYYRVFRVNSLRRKLPPIGGFDVLHGFRPAPAIEQELFKSATMGPIRMSREFRKLLLENRDAVQTAVSERNYNARGMIVSKSRDAIAKYVSELEERVNDLTAKLQSATVQGA